MSACAICLNTVGTSGAEFAIPRCAHTFCQDCFAQFLESKIQSQARVISCPSCDNQIDRAVLIACVGKDHPLVSTFDEILSQDLSISTANMSRSQLRAFKKHAREKHLKMCPVCHAPIEKNGGCNHMSCRCGSSFQWNEASFVFPCDRIHVDKNQPLGKTCPNCTESAKWKLIAWRSSLALAALPVALVVLPVALPIKGLQDANQKFRDIQHRKKHRAFLRSKLNVRFLGKEGPISEVMSACTGSGVVLHSSVLSYCTDIPTTTIRGKNSCATLLKPGAHAVGDVREFVVCVDANDEEGLQHALTELIPSHKHAKVCLVRVTHNKNADATATAVVPKPPQTKTVVSTSPQSSPSSPPRSTKLTTAADDEPSNSAGASNDVEVVETLRSGVSWVSPPRGVLLFELNIPGVPLEVNRAEALGILRALHAKKS